MNRPAAAGFQHSCLSLTSSTTDLTLELFRDAFSSFVRFVRVCKPEFTLLVPVTWVVVKSRGMTSLKQ